MTTHVQSDSEQPGVAVAGAGYWGVNHVRNFFELGALAAVCDSSPPALSKISERYPGLRIETDYQRILSDQSIRGVVIATPAETHFEMAARAIEAGKDVLVEKPMTLDAAGGERLTALARERGALLMVGHLLEYHPGVRRLRELITTGTLGELRYIYSSRLNLGKVRREENILWSFAPHDIAIILRLVDSPPSRVAATGAAYLQPRIADVTVTNIEFLNGVRAHIFVSWLHPYKEQRMAVVGSRQMAVLDDVRKTGKLVIYDQGVEFVNGEPVARKNEAVEEPIDSGEPLRLECLHFLECIKTRQRPLTDGESGLRVLRVLDAAERSLAEGGSPVDMTAAG